MHVFLKQIIANEYFFLDLIYYDNVKNCKIRGKIKIATITKPNYSKIFANHAKNDWLYRGFTADETIDLKGDIADALEFANLVLNRVEEFGLNREQFFIRKGRYENRGMFASKDDKPKPVEEMLPAIDVCIVKTFNDWSHKKQELVEKTEALSLVIHAWDTGNGLSYEKINFPNARGLSCSSGLDSRKLLKFMVHDDYKENEASWEQFLNLNQELGQLDFYQK